MIHFLSGEDWYRIREREEELAADFLERFPKALKDVRDAENFSQRDAESLREIISGGLFATPALILFRQAGAVEDAAAAQSLKGIFEAARERGEINIIASHVGKGKKTHPLVAWLLKKGEAEEVKPLSPLEYRRYAPRLLEKLVPGSKIEKQAMDFLVENARGETGRLAQTLTKLALFRNRETITLEDAHSLSETSPENNIFAAFDQLLAGRREEALVLLRREEKEQVPIQKTLGLCAWQLRRLLEVQELSEGGRRPLAAIAKELKASPYAIQKMLPSMRRFPLERLKRGVSLLAELDKGIRSGRTQPGVAIDLFIWKF